MRKGNISTNRKIEMGKTNHPIRIKQYFILRMENISTNRKIRMPRNHPIRIKLFYEIIRKYFNQWENSDAKKSTNQNYAFLRNN